MTLILSEDQRRLIEVTEHNGDLRTQIWRQNKVLAGLLVKIEEHMVQTCIELLVASCELSFFDSFREATVYRATPNTGAYMLFMVTNDPSVNALGLVQIKNKIASLVQRATRIRTPERVVYRENDGSWGTWRGHLEH